MAKIGGGLLVDSSSHLWQGGTWLLCLSCFVIVCMCVCVCACVCVRACEVLVIISVKY